MSAGSATHRVGALLDRLESKQAPERRDRNAAIVLAAAIVLYAVLAIYLTRGATFAFDGMTWFAKAADGFAANVILEPHNGHLIALTRLLYAGTVRVFGPDEFVIGLARIFAVSASAVLLFVLLKRRLSPFVALVPTLLILFLGSTPVLLDSNVAVFAQTTALGLGAFLALERGDRFGDALACVLLVLAVLSFSLGVPFVVGAAVLIAPGADRFRRAWVVLIPLVVYGAWFVWAQKFQTPGFQLGGGGPEVTSFSNILLAPRFGADSLAAALAALTGLGHDFSSTSVGGSLIPLGWGRVLAVAFVWIVAWRIALAGITSRTAAFIAVLLAYWAAGALTVSVLRVPEIDRYVFTAAILCVLIAAETVRGIPLRRNWYLMLIGVAILALPANLAQMRVTGAAIRDRSDAVRAQLAAVTLERDRIGPDFRLSDDLLIPVDAGSYFGAADRYGSVAFSEDQLLDQPPVIRERVDTTLGRILTPRVAEGAAPHGRCELQQGMDGSVDVTLPSGGAVLRATSEGRVGLRRFGDAATIEAGSLAPGRFATLAIPPDASAQPWIATVEGPSTVTVCPLEGVETS